MRQHLFSLAVFASLCPFATAQAQPLVQSQEGIALENQILQLQQQIQSLQAGSGNAGGSSLGNDQSSPPPASGGGSSPPDSSVVTSLLNQVGQLQSQVQQLSGEVDTLQNQVNTQHDATEKEIGDLKFAVTGGAGAAAAGAAPAGPAAAAPAGPTLPPTTAPASPKAALKAAQAAYAKGDYTAAEADSRAILASAKSSPQGYQAQLLLAQSLAAEGRPQDAAIAYDDTYNRDRAGAYAPVALLGLANSLTAIHQESAACDTLASLNSQFPTPPAGLAPRIEAASHRAHCS